MRAENEPRMVAQKCPAVRCVHIRTTLNALRRSLPDHLTSSALTHVRRCHPSRQKNRVGEKSISCGSLCGVHQLMSLSVVVAPLQVFGPNVVRPSRINGLSNSHLARKRRAHASPLRPHRDNYPCSATTQAFDPHSFHALALCATHTTRTNQTRTHVRCRQRYCQH
jgi:hypothetical protein